MFDIYKRVIPSCGGYINEAGIINLERLEIIVTEIEKLEHDAFVQASANESWLKSKQSGQCDTAMPEKKTPTTITSSQKALLKQVKKFTLYSDDSDLDLPSTLNAADRKFVTDLANALGLQHRIIVSEDDEKHIQLHFRDDQEEEEEEGEEAVKRVFKKYDHAQVSDQTVEEAEAAMVRKYQEKFEEWKDQYYKVSYYSCVSFDGTGESPFFGS